MIGRGQYYIHWASRLKLNQPNSHWNSYLVLKILGNQELMGMEAGVVRGCIQGQLNRQKEGFGSGLARLQTGHLDAGKTQSASSNFPSQC